MDIRYFSVTLAILQIAVVFLPIPLVARYRPYLSAMIQIAFLIGIGFYTLLNSAITAVYFTIPCFLLIFLLSRFGKLIHH